MLQLHSLPPSYGVSPVNRGSGVELEQDPCVLRLYHVDNYRELMCRGSPEAVPRWESGRSEELFIAVFLSKLQ